MNLRWIMPLGLAAFAGGCATPNLERIATVQSRAEALYAYGGVATFPVSSELVEVSVFAPVHHEREYLPIPIEREKTKPVVNRQPAKPAVSEPPTKAAVSEPITKPAVSEPPTKAVGEQSTTPPSEPPTKRVVSEPDHSADANTQEQAAPTTAEEAASQPKEKLPESAETTEAQKVPVVATEQPAAQLDKPQAADVRLQTLAADTRVSEKQPTFQKKVSKDRVNVGEKFAFTMEFQNSTPLDLASVQLTDPVDARLKLFPDQITVKPNYEHHVSVGNGQVVVRFTKEIKRGKKVRVTVPVMFPATSAAAAQ
jgi:fimbrial isopeptide formation D2 family protein